MKKIAWIGTGVMGRPMALHLAHAGHLVTAYNRTIEKALILEPEIKVKHSIAECIKDADVVITMVGVPNDVDTVYQEIFLHAKRNALLIDMTTSSPKLAQKLHETAKEYELRILDAPVTGGDVGAIHATLTIMVGGDEQDYKEALPIFERLGKNINYMGSSGSGQHAKLANQIAIAANIAGLAESLSYAKSKKLDLTKTLDILMGGSASSWQAIHNGPKMLESDDRPGFFVKHFLKDLKLALAESEALNLEILAKVKDLYEWLNHNGYSDLGTQTIIEYYQKKL